MNKIEDIKEKQTIEKTLLKRIEAERLEVPVPRYARCENRLCEQYGNFIRCYTIRNPECSYRRK